MLMDFDGKWLSSDTESCTKLSLRVSKGTDMTGSESCKKLTGFLGLRF